MIDKAPRQVSLFILSSPKEGSLTSFSTISTSGFNNDFVYGEIISGQYPLSASITSSWYTTGAPTLAQPKREIQALRTALNSYSPLSPHYAYTSSLGNKQEQEMRIVSIPSIFYGSSIKKGSISVKVYVSGTLQCELVDDLQNGELRQNCDSRGCIAHENLFGMWTFDQSLADNEWNPAFGDVLDDESGNGYDMDPRPGAADIPQVAGKCEQAAHFNGPSPHGDEESFRVDIPLVDGGITGSAGKGGGFSVSSWVNRSIGFLTPFAQNDLVPVIAGGAPFIGWELLYNDWDAANPIVTWRVQDPSGMAWMIFTTSSAPNGPDGWTHLVGTYQSGSTPRLYVNGEIQADEGVQFTLGVVTGDISSSRIQIGAGGEPNRTPSGSIDDCRLYNKVLDADEIKTLYEGNACPCNELFAPSGSVAGVALYNEGFLILTGSWDLGIKHLQYNPDGGCAAKPARWIDVLQSPPECDTDCIASVLPIC